MIMFTEEFYVTDITEQPFLYLTKGDKWSTDILKAEGFSNYTFASNKILELCDIMPVPPVTIQTVFSITKGFVRQ
jgi:hypothetical protein